MKKSEIKVGGVYLAKVSNKLTRVRVDAIRERRGFSRTETVFDVTNLSTGKKTTFRSAQKFRGETKTAGLPRVGDDVKSLPLTSTGYDISNREEE